MLEAKSLVLRKEWNWFMNSSHQAQWLGYNLILKVFDLLLQELVGRSLFTCLYTSFLYLQAFVTARDN